MRFLWVFWRDRHGCRIADAAIPGPGDSPNFLQPMSSSTDVIEYVSRFVLAPPMVMCEPDNVVQPLA